MILWKQVSDAADDIHTSHTGIKSEPNPVFLAAKGEIVNFNTAHNA